LLKSNYSPTGAQIGARRAGRPVNGAADPALSATFADLQITQSWG